MLFNLLLFIFSAGIGFVNCGPVRSLSATPSNGFRFVNYGTPAATLDHLCQELDKLKNDSLQFSRNDRKLFWEAQFDLCDVDNRPIAEEVYKCLDGEMKKNPYAAAKCNLTHARLSEVDCQNKKDFPEALSCLLKDRLQTCKEGLQNGSSMELIITYFQLSIRSTFPSAKGSCAREVIDGLGFSKRIVGGLMRAFLPDSQKK